MPRPSRFSRRTRLAAAMLAGLGAASGHAAAADGPAGGSVRPCSCEARDGMHPVGAVVCLRVGGREQLARCERVLNNTSWRVIREGCPVAAVPLAAPLPAPRG